MILTRPAIARVLQSLVTAELMTSRGRRERERSPSFSRSWPETLRIDDATGTGDALGCDSLERIWLAAAVNEMFHLHEAEQDGGLLDDLTFGAWIDRIEATWRGGVGCLTFSTSGSTGRPKRCRHTAEHLLAEISFLSARWRDRSRVVALLPAHHIYGFLFTALLPDALGVPCLDATHIGPGELSRSLRARDLVVTFPERWHWLERSLESWPPDVEGVVSTAPCPAELIQSLREAGLANMTEIYGSTETAGIATREWPDEAYHLMPQWKFAPPFNDAQPTLIHKSGCQVPLMDVIHRNGENGFTLAGRRDDMVQIGGLNVLPERIAEQLRARPSVANAAVRLMHPTEGSRLKAFIVLEEGSDPEAVRKDLETWMSTNLLSPERPRSLTFGACLPAGIMGKALDW